MPMCVLAVNLYHIYTKTEWLITRAHYDEIPDFGLLMNIYKLHCLRTLLKQFYSKNNWINSLKVGNTNVLLFMHTGKLLIDIKHAALLRCYFFLSTSKIHILA